MTPITPLRRFPRTVVEDATGIRHRVASSWLDEKGNQLVQGECGQLVVLGGRGHDAPRRCPAELANA